MDKLKPLFPYLLLVVVSAVLVFILYPSTAPTAGIQLPLSAETIVERSRRLLDSLSINVAGLNSNAQLKFQRPLLRQLQQEFGLEKANEFSRGKLPVYYWEVRWTTPSALSEMISKSSGGAEVQTEEIQNFVRGNVFLRLDTQGGLLELERKMSDSLRLSAVSSTQARKMAEQFIRHFSPFANLQVDTTSAQSKLPPPIVVKLNGKPIQKTEPPQRTDYEFTWWTTEPELKDRVTVKASVAGNFVSKYAVTYEVPEQYSKYTLGTVQGVTAGVIYVVLCIVLVIAVFKRARAFEIGFRTGIYAGIFAALAQGFHLYLSIYQESGLEILIPVLGAPLFVGGVLIIFWAASESTVRETWKEKFIPVDLLVNGYLLHSRVGSAIVRGVALGAASLALWLVLVKVAGVVSHLWLFGSDETNLPLFYAFSPAMYVITGVLYSPLYFLAIVVMFFLSFLRGRVARTPLFFVIASLVIGLLNREHLQPLAAGILIESIVATLLVWTFFRFDVLTSLVLLMSYTMLSQTANLLTVGNSSYSESGLILLGVLGFVLAGSTASLFRKNEIVDFDSITPAFARHISERQRLQQELEIARTVQMTFLPKKNPDFPGLNIASRCAPALEVGGDYYDFITVGERKLGIAIGDVSGKGTQAAFYMTLTKGFLRALARVSDSPAKVLTEANKLFYDNVERGSFISMVYAIFDSERHTVSLARAGHNPVIMRKPQADNVEVIHPTGLALGMEAGETFAKTIQEVTIPYQSGDLFVLYTDGFPEAMNKKQEEFGEDRLCDVIQRYSTATAQEVLDGIFKEMGSFVGKANQHDDMTIVVVKVV